jgi:hypothetical protein
MAQETPDVEVRLDSQYGEFVLNEPSAHSLSSQEVVQRAIALYAILTDAIESGQQLVLQYLFDTAGEQLIRIDHYLPPGSNSDLTEIPTVTPSQRTQAELLAWPQDQISFAEWRRRVRQRARAVDLTISVLRSQDYVLVVNPEWEPTEDDSRAIADLVGGALTGTPLSFDEALRKRRRQRLRLVRSSRD